MKSVRFIIPLTVFVLGVASIARAGDTVSEETIREIERQVIMPASGGALEDYDRYYAPDERDGVQLVRGTFLRRNISDRVRTQWQARGRRPFTSVGSMPNVFVADNANALPLVEDGSCSVVRIEFDVGAQQLVPFPDPRNETAEIVAICNGPTIF